MCNWLNSRAVVADVTSCRIYAGLQRGAVVTTVALSKQLSRRVISEGGASVSQ